MIYNSDTTVSGWKTFVYNIDIPFLYEVITMGIALATMINAQWI